MKKYKKHRKIVERSLGRKLRPGEVVHHKDKNPENNDISNLAVMTEEAHKVLHLRGKNAYYKYLKKNSTA